MEAARWLSEGLDEEFSGAQLNDPRRNRRLNSIASKLAVEPGASFPDLFCSPAELEGFYRFLRNDAIEWGEVLKPHVRASCERASHLGECLVLHDTTQFAFSGERRGLGLTYSKAQGFLAHVSLLVATDEARTPLGVGALQQLTRSGGKGRRSSKDVREDETSESKRWLSGAAAVEEEGSGRFSCIHVADREGDAFGFISGLTALGSRFVIRAAYDRRVVDEDDEPARVHEILGAMAPRASYQIQLAPRGKRLNPTMAKKHPSRRQRDATVAIAAAPVTMPPSSHALSGPSLELNLVRVWEENPPEGEAPVQWILWTTEPIDTDADIRRVVDFYRARWVVEEYFKALKTGCQFERRQLESFDTLSTALALFAPVAWKLLLARAIAKKAPDSPPTFVLSPLQIEYLEKYYDTKLTTAKDALLATARLGGHQKQNGEPGWLTLGRGYEKLATGEAFYRVVNGASTCDQS